MIWDQLVECQKRIIQLFDDHGVEVNEPGMEHFNNDLWINRVWENKDVRRAHIDVVDARETKGLWMMHVCLFPVLTNDGPIYGFDVIAGKSKMTGAWATNIFTPSMIAAGNVREEEAGVIIKLAEDNLSEYLSTIGDYTGEGDRDITIASQNYYCENQQKNPHTPRTMKSLGLNEADVDKFCTDMLFPKI